MKVTEVNDGGPAFPQWDGHAITSEPNYLGGGISIRDYFAAAAMQGLIACQSTADARREATQEMTRRGLSHNEMDKLVSRCAYDYADAMIAERNKTVAQ